MRTASRTSLQRAGRGLIMAALMAAVAAAVACEDSDPVAPEGSTVIVTSNPQTVVVQSGIPGISTITATIRSSNGTRLPDQEVTFETTAGILDPPAQTPQLTNSSGQVTSELETTTTATVTATSGTISGSTTVQTVSGNLSSISLDAIPNDIQSCSPPASEVQLTATALDTSGNGVAGLTVRFETSTASGRIELAGSFNPTQPRTDVNGEATSTFTPSQNFCDSNCASPNSGSCGIEIIATDITGNFESAPVIITESVP